MTVQKDGPSGGRLQARGSTLGDTGSTSTKEDMQCDDCVLWRWRLPYRLLW